VEPQLAAYVERGDLRFIFQHRIVLGTESQWAAEAVECAADQGKFWAYHSKLMTNQSGVGNGAFAKANLKKFAREIGLDAKEFAACIDSGKHTQHVLQEDQEARALGVEGTPNFLLGNQLIQGLPDVNALLGLIDQALSNR